MTRAVPILPAAQLGAASALYGQTTLARRRRLLAGLAVVAALVAMSGSLAEIRPATFFDNVQNFPNYIGRILPELRWATLGQDLAAWYWNLPKWLSLLGETILIAYLGTLTGALGGFRALLLRQRQPGAFAVASG